MHRSALSLPLPSISALRAVSLAVLAFLLVLDDPHPGRATICKVPHDSRYVQHADRAIHLFDAPVVDHEIAVV